MCDGDRDWESDEKKVERAARTRDASESLTYAGGGRGDWAGGGGWEEGGSKKGSLRAGWGQGIPVI